MGRSKGARMRAKSLAFWYLIAFLVYSVAFMAVQVYYAIREGKNWWRPLAFLPVLMLGTAQAQTLRWTTEVPTPDFQQESAMLPSVRGDSVGTVALGIHYLKKDMGNDVPAGSQVLWVSAAGKVLHSDKIPIDELRFPVVVGVSSATLVVWLLHLDGHSVLRKYTRRGVTVTHLDTHLPAGEEPLGDFGYLLPADRLGFTTIAREVNGIPTAVKRFSLR